MLLKKLKDIYKKKMLDNIVEKTSQIKARFFVRFLLICICAKFGFLMLIYFPIALFILP